MPGFGACVAVRLEPLDCGATPKDVGVLEQWQDGKIATNDFLDAEIDRASLFRIANAAALLEQGIDLGIGILCVARTAAGPGAADVALPR